MSASDLSPEPAKQESVDVAKQAEIAAEFQVIEDEPSEPTPTKEKVEEKEEPAKPVVEEEPSQPVIEKPA